MGDSKDAELSIVLQEVQIVLVNFHFYATDAKQKTSWHYFVEFRHYKLADYCQTNLFDLCRKDAYQGLLCGSLQIL